MSYRFCNSNLLTPSCMTSKGSPCVRLWFQENPQLTDSFRMSAMQCQGKISTVIRAGIYQKFPKNLLIIGSSRRRRGHARNGNRWCKQDEEEEVREEGHFNVKEVISKQQFLYLSTREIFPLGSLLIARYLPVNVFVLSMKNLNSVWLCLVTRL